MLILMPSFVFGAGKLDRSADDFDRGSNAILLGHLLGKPTGPLLTISVHIGDIAGSHVAALEPSVPAGRYPLESEERDWSVARGVVKENVPDQIGKLFPEDIETKAIRLHLDGSKAEKTFGLRFKGFEEQVRGTMECYYLGLLLK